MHSSEISDGWFKSTKSADLLLVACLAALTAITPFILLLAMCGCCGKKKREKKAENVKKTDDTETGKTSETPVAPAPIDPTPAPAPTTPVASSPAPTASVPSAPALAPIPIPSLIPETPAPPLKPDEPIIPKILQEQAPPAYRSLHGTADDHAYFEVGGGSRMQPGDLKLSQAPMKMPAYRTIAALDQKFESSTIIGKKGKILAKASASLSPAIRPADTPTLSTNPPVVRSVPPTTFPIIPSTLKKGNPTISPGLSPQAQAQLGRPATFYVTTAASPSPYEKKGSASKFV